MAWPLDINKSIKYLKMSAGKILPWNFGCYVLEAPTGQEYTEHISSDVQTHIFLSALRWASTISTTML